MPSICFYFQVHQPYRLRNYSFFDIGHSHDYFDENKNRIILDKVAEKCYLPTNKLMLDLIEKHRGKFKISYALSGVFLEQCIRYRPDIIKSFQDLVKTGCVDLISETYFHSLAYIFNKEEFKKQVEIHQNVLLELFHYSPKVFRNTELQYNNELAAIIESMGYKAIISEGLDRILDWRSPNFIYKAPNVNNIKTLLKNYKLSDDIAFRFSDRNWSCWPLYADTFASWVHSLSGNADTINLFMDYETFGEHQWAESGIFEFMKFLPSEILKRPDWSFKTVSQTAEAYPIRGEYDCHNITSWADMERDLSAWLGNPMQDEAASKIYELEQAVMQSNNQKLISDWRKLQTSDHFYYMCTKYWSDGDVHKYFSPFDSPYDAYIYYMNALSDLKNRLAL